MVLVPADMWTPPPTAAAESPALIRISPIASSLVETEDPDKMEIDPDEPAADTPVWVLTPPDPLSESTLAIAILPLLTAEP
jgi:hypothetical protein